MALKRWQVSRSFEEHISNGHYEFLPFNRNTRVCLTTQIHIFGMSIARRPGSEVPRLVSIGRFFKTFFFYDFVRIHTDRARP